MYDNANGINILKLVLPNLDVRFIALTEICQILQMKIIIVSFFSAINLINLYFQLSSYNHIFIKCD
jgi:hypothetical protein